MERSDQRESNSGAKRKYDDVRSGSNDYDSRDDWKRRKAEDSDRNGPEFRAPVEPVTEILVAAWNDSTHIVSVLERQKTLSKTMFRLALANMSVEVERGRKFDQIRREFRQLCNSRLGIDDPKESFNRFIMERHMLYPYGKAGAEECDPLIPSSVQPLPPPVLFREVMEDVPVKLPWPKDAAQVFDNIQTFSKATERFLMPRRSSLEPQSLETVLTRLQGAWQWADQNKKASNMSQEDVQTYLDTLKQECEPLIKPIATPLVTEICEKIVAMSDRAALDLISRRATYLERPRVMLPRVRPSSRDRNSISVEYDADYFTIHKNLYEKLKYLYEKTLGRKLHRTEDDEDFHGALWALHYRYRTLLGGLRKFEGSGLQAAVPPHTFDALTRVFDVSMECFASPFNCNFANFCSVFDDIDPLFGSSGSFFKFHPVEGSFEVNPPFCEELMEKMNAHMESLLAASEKPLSFIIFLPHWMSPPSPPIEYLKVSKFLRAKFIVDAHEHKYVSGFQQTAEVSRTFTPVHSSIVFFLQNDAGYAKWTPTEQKVADVKRAFLPS